MIVQDLVYRIGGNTAGFARSMQQSQRQLSGFTDQIGTSTKKLQLMGAAAGAMGVAVVAALSSVVRQTASTQAELAGLANQAGVATSSIQRLGWAAENNHASMRSLGLGLARLDRRLGQASAGNDRYRRAFERMGVSIKNAEGGLRDADEVFIDIASSFEEIEDSGEKAELAFSIMGRSGRDLLPVLNEGRAEILRLANEADRLGIVLSEDNVEAFVEYDDNLNAFQHSLGGVTNLISTAFLPVMNEVVQGATEGIQQFREWIVENKTLASTLLMVGSALTAFAIAIGGLSVGMMVFGKTMTFIIGLIKLITSPIILAITSLGLMYTAWDNDWKGIRTTTEEAVSDILDYLNRVKDWWNDTALGEVIGQALRDMTATWSDEERSLREKVADSIEVGTTLAVEVVAILVDQAGQAITSIHDWWMGYEDEIEDEFGQTQIIEVEGARVRVWASIVGGLNWVRERTGEVVSSLSDWWMGYEEEIEDDFGAPEIVEIEGARVRIRSIIASGIEWFSERTGEALTALSEWWHGYEKEIYDEFGEPQTVEIEGASVKIRAIITDAVEWVSDRTGQAISSLTDWWYGYETEIKDEFGEPQAVAVEGAQVWIWTSILEGLSWFSDTTGEIYDTLRDWWLGHEEEVLDEFGEPQVIQVEGARVKIWSAIVEGVEFVRDQTGQVIANISDWWHGQQTEIVDEFGETQVIEIEGAKVRIYTRITDGITWLIDQTGRVTDSLTRWWFGYEDEIVDEFGESRTVEITGARVKVWTAILQGINWFSDRTGDAVETLSHWWHGYEAEIVDEFGSTETIEIPGFKVRVQAMIEAVWQWTDDLASSLALFIQENMFLSGLKSGETSLLDLTGDGEFTFFDVTAGIRIVWYWAVDVVSSFAEWIRSEDTEGERFPGVAELRSELQDVWDSEVGTVIRIGVMVAWSIAKALPLAASVAAAAGLTATSAGRAGPGWILKLGILYVAGDLMWDLVPEDTRDTIDDTWDQIAEEIRKEGEHRDNPYLQQVSEWMMDIEITSSPVVSLISGVAMWKVGMALFSSFKLAMAQLLVGTGMFAAGVAGLMWSGAKIALAIGAVPMIILGLATAIGWALMSGEKKDSLEEAIQAIIDDEELTISVKVGKILLEIADAVWGDFFRSIDETVFSPIRQLIGTEETEEGRMARELATMTEEERAKHIQDFRDQTRDADATFETPPTWFDRFLQTVGLGPEASAVEPTRTEHSGDLKGFEYTLQEMDTLWDLWVSFFAAHYQDFDEFQDKVREMNEELSLQDLEAGDQIIFPVEEIDGVTPLDLFEGTGLEDAIEPITKMNESIDELTNETDNTTESSSKLVDGLSDYEMTLLAAIAQLEAVGDGVEGMALIIETISNRIDTEGRYGDDVESVIREEGQYEPAGVPSGKDTSPLDDLIRQGNVAEDAVEAVILALDRIENHNMVLPDGTVYFANLATVAQRLQEAEAAGREYAGAWMLDPLQMEPVYQYGGHTFGVPGPEYKEGGWTGDGSVDKYAGFVHNRELVIPWDAMKRGLAGILEFLGVQGFQEGRGEGALAGVGADQQELDVTVPQTAGQATQKWLQSILDTVTRMGSDISSTLGTVFGSTFDQIEALAQEHAPGMVDRLRELREEMELQIDSVDVSVAEWEDLFEGLGDQIDEAREKAEAYAKSLSDGFVSALQSGQSFGEAMLSMLQNIGWELIRTGLWKMIGPGFTDLVEGLPIFHSGGMVLQPAAYFHSGGMINGLSNDEVPIVAQTGERVLSREQNDEFEELLQDPKEMNVNIYAVDSRSFTEMVQRNPDAIVSAVTGDYESNGKSRRIIGRR